LQQKRIAGFAARGHAPLKKPALATGTVTAGRFDIRKLGAFPAVSVDRLCGPSLWAVFCAPHDLDSLCGPLLLANNCPPTVARQQLPAGPDGHCCWTRPCLAYPRWPGTACRTCRLCPPAASVHLLLQRL